MAVKIGIGGRRYLPEELQARILIRLPVKVLVRFELVCKSWRSLFRSRYFIQLYGCRSNDEDAYKTISKDDMMKKITPQLYDHEVVRKSGSKELITAVNVLGPSNSGVYCVTSHVFNLTTRNWASLLTGKIAFFNLGIRHMRFANPFPTEIASLLSKTKPHSLYFGFGSLPINSSQGDLDYKAAMIVDDLLRDRYFLVYSLKSGEWKMIHGFRSIVVGLFIEQPLEVCAQRFFQGCWHWMAFSIGEVAQSNFVLLSFNFGDETLRRINGPPFSITLYEVIQSAVFVLRGHLSVVYLSINKTQRRCSEVNVWMMNKYGAEDSWTKIYTLYPDYHGICVTLNGVFCKQRDDGEEESDEIVTSVWIGGSDGSTTECSRQGNTASALPDPYSNIYWNTPGVSTYIETMERF